MSIPTNEVSFSVEGHVFSFKRDELCDASEYFRAMLNGNFSESNKDCIVLEEIDLEVFSIFHEWMNPTDTEFSLTAHKDDVLLQLIYLMERLFVHKLLQLCIGEIMNRIENKEKFFDEFEWENEQSRNEKMLFFCQFFEVAVEIDNSELKEFCVKWLVQEKFQLSKDDPKERLEDIGWLIAEKFKISKENPIRLLENMKRQIANVTEVEQIKEICNALSEPALFVLERMLTEYAKTFLKPIENAIGKEKATIQAAAAEIIAYYARAYIARRDRNRMAEEFNRQQQMQ